jgi:hypothetical protein
MQIISPKMVESEDEWYHQEVLLKSFPMNGHVSSDNLKFWGQFLCVLSLMTEKPNSPEFK